ncbi:MAG: transglutaminase family protein [Bacteroidota bacterium]|nr:transglutaminase family protein [Bacteroidota bacterium]
MKFQVASTLQYNVKDYSTFIFNISALKSPSQSVLEESLFIEPYIRAEELYAIDLSSRSVRITSNKTNVLKVKYNALVNHNVELVRKEKLNLVAPSGLPVDALNYLFPSRYCQSDKLYRLAQDKFGDIPHAYDTVLSICSWINKNVEYASGSTGSETSAFDTVTQRVGVCRDFAHLGIALCRALTIPARYFSCYAYKLEPPDFHACFEAYLGGKWIVFDPTELAPLNGLIRVGTGRDAADVSVATMYGNVSFASMEVSCYVEEENFQALYLKDLGSQGICL